MPGRGGSGASEAFFFGGDHTPRTSMTMSACLLSTRLFRWRLEGLVSMGLVLHELRPRLPVPDKDLRQGQVRRRTGLQPAGHLRDGERQAVRPGGLSK